MNPGTKVSYGIVIVLGLGALAALWASSIPMTLLPKTRRSKAHRWIIRSTGRLGEARVLHMELVELVLELRELIQSKEQDVWSRAVEFFSRTSGWNTRCTKLANSISKEKLPIIRGSIQSLAHMFLPFNGPTDVNRTPEGQTVTLDTLIIGGKNGISLLQASYWQQSDPSDRKTQEAEKQLTAHLNGLIDHITPSIEALGRLPKIQGPSLGQITLGCDKA